MEEDQTSSLENSAEMSYCDMSMEDKSSNLPATEVAGPEREHVDVLTLGAGHSTREHFQELQSQNEQLQQQALHYQQEAKGLQEALHNSRAHTGALKEHVEDLERRRDNAVSTLFRLRPQRRECTEAEVKQEYHLLKISIEGWVDRNCEDFLDNEQLGCEMIGKEKVTGTRSQIHGYEYILKNFHSQPDRWHDGKDQVLIAVIMRYICDTILRCSFPVWLYEEDRTLLYEIEDSMKSLDPKRDLQTRRNWRSDTILSLVNCPKFQDRRARITEALVEGVLKIVQRTLPTASRMSTSSIMKSLLSEVIEPSLALAQKIQCASSIWDFKYSPYWSCPPGQPAGGLPDFFKNIFNFHCVNLTAHRKILKPATDLQSREQQARLIYLLDVFPGLYCSRVDMDKALPAQVISQPVILVGFAAPTSSRGVCSLEPRTRIEHEKQSKDFPGGKGTSLVSRLLGGS